MTKVFIKSGLWRNQNVYNMEFDMISNDIMNGQNGLYVTVDGAPVASNTRKIRIYIRNREDAVISGRVTEINTDYPEHIRDTQDVGEIPLEGDFGSETEAEAIGRITERFSILNEMTLAAARGIVRSIIVSGSPGVGKSYGINETLEKHRDESDDGFNFTVISGNMSSIGLYQALWDHHGENNVLVLDDNDSVFFDTVSLGLLKAALDTGSKRTLHWNTESQILDEREIPRSFDFEGSVIFVTNMDLESSKSKQLKPHFDALISRSHYLDLSIKTMRDKYLRIKGLVQSTDILDEIPADVQQEILDYIRDNAGRLKELSNRTAIKIADLVKLTRANWRRLADVTVCKHQ